MPKAKKTPANFPYVTLREIQNCIPCSGDYIPFLKDLKSNPVENAGHNYAPYAKKFAQSQYGPDDPIPLQTILDTPTSSHRDGLGRVLWIIECVARLRPLYRHFDNEQTRLRDEPEEKIEAEALASALASFGQPAKKATKKSPRKRAARA